MQKSLREIDPDTLGDPLFADRLDPFHQHCCTDLMREGDYRGGRGTQTRY